MLFRDILGPRFFAILLNRSVTITDTLHSFLSRSVSQRPPQSPGFPLSSALIRLTWCSAQGASTSLTCIGSSQLGASTQRWAWSLSKALAASCVPHARPLWMRVELTISCTDVHHTSSSNAFLGHGSGLPMRPEHERTSLYFMLKIYF